MTAATQYRLDGLEPDNLLAFMALIGLLRVIEAADKLQPETNRLIPRVSWSIDEPPLRPILHVRQSITREDLTSLVQASIPDLSKDYSFDREKLKFSIEESRKIFIESAKSSASNDRTLVDLWSALICDVSDDDEIAGRTPLSLLDVAQTSFLKNLSKVFNAEIIPGRRKKESPLGPHLEKCLYHQWTSMEDTPSFRWDPIEAARHAYRWSAPSDDKQGVEFGANILAALSLPVFPLIPSKVYTKIRPNIPGGRIVRGSSSDTGFSISWPIWIHPTSFSAIRNLLSHSSLGKPQALEHLGVVRVMVAKRISMGKYMNFTRAMPLEG